MLSELEVVVIIEASMLEEVFQGDSDVRAEIPNMKVAIFVQLPRLRQEIEFLTVKDCWVENCPKLSLSSSLQSFDDSIDSIEGFFKGTWFVFQRLKAALCDKIYEENQHEHDFESNELEDIVKQNEERIEEEQEIVEKASMAISPTDTPLNKRQSPVPSEPQLREDRGVERVEERKELVGRGIEVQTFQSTDQKIKRENDEGQMVIPSSNLNMELPITKDVNCEAFHGTSNSVATHHESINPPGSKLRNQLIGNTLQEMSDDVYEDSKGRVISNQNEMAKATEDFPIGNKVEVASGTELNSLQEIKRTCEEEGTTSTYAKIIALSTDSESVSSLFRLSVTF